MDKSKRPSLTLKIAPRSFQNPQLNTDTRLEHIIRDGQFTANIVYTDLSSGNHIFVGGNGCFIEGGTFYPQKNTVIPSLAGVISLANLIPGGVRIEGERHLIQLDDSPWAPINKYFDECNSFIAKYLAIGNVFVHCQAGISRSVTIVAAYLMKVLGYSATNAVDKIKAARIQAEPNRGFMQQLEAFHAQLLH